MSEAGFNNWIERIELFLNNALITDDGPTIIITKVSRFCIEGSLISWDTQGKGQWCPLSIPLPGDLLEIYYRIDLLQLNS